jgi:hypothetical protein
VRAALVALALLLALAGCSDGDPGADGDVESLGDLVPAPLADELTETGRCDDGRLWAATDDGSLSVVVALDPESVTVLHEEDPCSGEGGSPAVAGRVEVEGCTVSVDGLEAADGTTFGPIEMAAPC